MADDEESTVEKNEFSEDSESQESEEHSLEDLASEQPEMREADSFSETMIQDSVEIPTPTISSEPIQNASSETQFQEPEKSLEESAAASIGDPSGFQQPEKQEDYISVYNEPDYQGSVKEETVLNHMRERGMTANTFEDLRNTQRAVNWEEYPELAGARQGTNPTDLREYLVTELERPDDSPKSILDRKRDYRPLKRR